MWGRDAAHARRIAPGKSLGFTIAAVLARGDFVTANSARPSIPGTLRAGLPAEARRARGSRRR